MSDPLQFDYYIFKGIAGIIYIRKMVCRPLERIAFIAVYYFMPVAHLCWSNIIYREDFVPTSSRQTSAGYRLVPVFFGIVLALAGKCCLVWHGRSHAPQSWDHDKVGKLHCHYRNRIRYSYIALRMKSLHFRDFLYTYNRHAKCDRGGRNKGVTRTIIRLFLSGGSGDANHYPAFPFNPRFFRQPRGRPRGRSVWSKPSALAIRRVHASPPAGRLRVRQSFTIFSSASLCGKFTVSSHRDGRGTGHALSSECKSCERSCRTWQLPHRHCSARRTRAARTGLRCT